ncbi:MAG: methionyl-tRNA formyltransferase, partial [Geminicoccales bacterium]
ARDAPARRRVERVGLLELDVVVERARVLGLAVAQPESVRDEEFLARLRGIAPDVAVVVAFGQIFPPALLEMPRRGCLNLHASLLPRYRGAAPVQAAIAAGERKTGVTTMLMDEGLDTGPILLQRELPIGDEETAETLEARLAAAGAELVLETLQALEQGELVPRPQREQSASYARRLSRDDARVDWALPAAHIFDRLRANTPWPGLYAYRHGRPVKILWGTPIDWEQAPAGSAGTFLGLRQGRLAILCGDETIFGLERLQRPGKQPITAADFARGERLRIGERFV